MNRRGFSLMEIYVSISVLSIGILALLQFFDAFSHLRQKERNMVKSVEAEIESVEYFVRNPPRCEVAEDLPGTNAPRNVRLSKGPLPDLIWVETERFRRLVECL